MRNRGIWLCLIRLDGLSQFSQLAEIGGKTLWIQDRNRCAAKDEKRPRCDHRYENSLVLAEAVFCDEQGHGSSAKGQSRDCGDS